MGVEAVGACRDLRHTKWPVGSPVWVAAQAAGRWGTSRSSRERKLGNVRERGGKRRNAREGGCSPFRVEEGWDGRGREGKESFSLVEG